MRFRFKFTLIIVLIPAVFILARQNQKFSVTSPDGKIKVTVTSAEDISVSVMKNGLNTLEIKEIGLRLKPFGSLPKPGIEIREERMSRSGKMPIPVPLKSAYAEYAYEELKLISGRYAFQIRVYNRGVAYRWQTFFNDRLYVENEYGKLVLPESSSVYYPRKRKRNDPFVSHFEESFDLSAADDVEEGRVGSLPVLFRTARGTLVAVSEGDLRDYPGWHLVSGGGGKFRYIFAAYPVKIVPGRKPDRDERILERADYIARTNGRRTYPWRIFAIEESAAGLLGNQMVALLSGEPQIEDFSWVRPGKVAWDWWNANNIYDVPFESGINMETYRYYIDFAAKYNLEYIILDEGWSETTNLLNVRDGMDIAELCRYGRSKGVGVILWTLWKPLDRQLDEALDTFQQWGAAGIKVDFMQRDDQWMVNYYERIAAAAAKREMIVDFHGAYKPSGLRNRYPNVLTYEGVKGLEHNKWSNDITPQHDLIIPFTRMFAGPMDYTPGAMRNANPGNFRIVFERPMSQGTRCHQLALYVVYESPLQMLADSPSNYLRDKKYTSFLASIPTVWDETKILKAETGRYIVLARRRGNRWFLAGLNGVANESFDVPLRFLGKGRYKCVIFKDGKNANRFAEDYSVAEKIVEKDERVKIDMMEGGGWCARFEPIGKP